MPYSPIDNKVWVVVPVFNEKLVIGLVLANLSARYKNLVVIDDGSTDGSSDEIKKFPVTAFRHEKNQGQGAALRSGIQFALQQGAEIVVTFDGDGQMTPDDIPALLAPLMNGESDVALGTRFGSTKSSQVPLLKKILLKLALLYTRGTLHLSLTDTHNGFRAFSRMAAEKIHIRQTGMAHASDILSQIAEHKLHYKEIPVRISYSAYSQRKRFPVLDMIKILWDLHWKK